MSEVLDAFRTLPPEDTLSAVPVFLSRYVAAGPVQDAVRAELEAARDATTLAEWVDLIRTLGLLGQDYGLQPSHPATERLGQAFLTPLVAPTSTLTGLEHLDATRGRVLLCGNHLSYADTVVLKLLLQRAGRAEARTLCPVAGPKVYQQLLRLFAVASHRSIAVAQSSQLQSNAAALSPRDLVRITKRCLADAERALDGGLRVLLFPEGTRSRSRRFQPFLKATGRWLTLPDTTIVPFAHWGAEAIYGLEEEPLNAGEVHARVGAPIPTAGRGRTELLEELHAAIDAMLPEPYRAEPGAPAWV